MKKQFRIILAIILCIVMLVPDIGFAQQIEISDIENHWAYKQIGDWLEKQLTTGYPDGTFRPEELISRAQFFAFVNRVFNFIERAEISYADVNTKDWFYTDIQKAVHAGYIDGFGEKDINPEKSITREEVAVILHRVLCLSGEEHLELGTMIKDSESVSGKYTKEVKGIVAEGLMRGNPEGRFMPQKPITRAEAVVALDRADKFPGKPERLEKPGVYSLGITKGNVLLSSGGIIIRDTIINGNLIINLINGDENIVLKNVKVSGKVIVRSNKEINIEVVDSILNEFIVEKDSSKIKLVTKGSTEIKAVVLNSAAVLEETGATNSGFINLLVGEYTPEGTEIFLTGSFDEILVKAKGVKIYLISGIINSLNIVKGASGNTITLSQGTRVKVLLLEAETSVLGKGIIEKAIIKSNGVNIEQKPIIVELGEGITANIGYGKVVSTSRGKNEDKNDGDNNIKRPIAKEGLKFILEMNEDINGKIISPPELAWYGNSIIEAVYSKDGIAELKVLDNVGLMITPVSIGDIAVTATVTNEYGEADVTFNVEIVDEKSEKDIIEEVKNGIVLKVENASGKQSKPTIRLPSSSDFVYDVNLEWITDNEEFILINGNTAEIKRRGNGDEEGCEDHEETMAALSANFPALSCEDDSEGSDSSKGGKKNIVYLVAVIGMGELKDSKEFKVTIPWGWGKAVTVTEKKEGEEDPNDGHDDGGCEEDEELKAIEGLAFDLWLNQFPLVLGASDLAAGGKIITGYQLVEAEAEQTVTEAVYEDNTPVVECKIAKDGRLWITPGKVGETSIFAWVSNAKSEEGCEKDLAAVDEQYDSDNEEESEVKVEVLITVKKPGNLSDEDAVEAVLDELELLLVSSGNGEKQTNKINLPDTDYQGHQTKITWNTDNSKFISIEDRKAIIYRRGKDYGTGGNEDNDEGGCEHLSILSALIAAGEVEAYCSDDGDDEGGCSEDGSIKGGNINTGTLVANITRGEENEEKTFKVYIPWGWGRKIIIKQE